MGDKSRIEWTDATWNPVTGCTPCSIGCHICYAERGARRFAGMHGYPAWPNHFAVTMHPNRLDIPTRWKKPRRIFVCSMGDLFHDEVSLDFIRRVWAIMGNSPQHTFQVLTKRPERMMETVKTLAQYPNIWLGVTVENDNYLKRIKYLLRTPAAVRFVSVEPMLGLVNLSGTAGKYIDNFLVSLNVRYHDRNRDFHRPGLDWVICGPENGPGARGREEFTRRARDLRDQCVAAGVPFFLKHNVDGTRLLDGREWNEYKELL